MAAPPLTSWLFNLPLLKRATGTWRSALVGRSLLGSAIAVVTISATAFAFLVLNDGMMHRGLGGDEGYFVWGGWSITKGLAPYRDFMEFKPPLVFLTHALALKLYGLHDLQFRRFFLYFPLASVVALQLALVSRRVDPFLALALGLALVRVWVNPNYHDTSLSDSESIGLAFYFLGVACLIVRVRRHALARVLGGAFLACCFLSKEPFLPCALFTWVSCFFLQDASRDRRAELIRYVKQTALGAAAVGAALCVYMIPTGSLRAYVAMVSRYSVVYRDPAQSFCVVGGVFQPTTPLNDLLRFGHRALRDFLNLPTLGVVVPFALAYVVFTWRRSVALTLWSAVACGFALYSVNVSNCPWIHYYNLSIGGIFLCAVAGLDSMTPYFRAAARHIRAFLRLAILGATFVQVWPAIDAERDAYGHRTFPSTFQEPVAGSFEAISAHTGPADRIFTSGNPGLYPETDRLSAVRESTLIDPMLPFYVGSTDEQKLRPIYDELSRNRPKIVILDPQFASQKERHRTALFDPFLRDFHYQEIQPHIFLRPN